MRIRMGTRARVVVAALLVAAVGVTPDSAFATRTLGLSAGTYHLSLAAGQQGSGEVTVINDGTEPLKVMVYAADMKVSERGDITYQTPTRTDLNSLELPSSWTTIKMPENSKSFGNVPYMEINPGQRIPVKFSVTVPPGVTPGDHNVVVFFESFEPPLPGEGAKSRVAGRLGTRVTMRVAGQFVRRLEVRPFTVPAYVIGGVVPFDFFVRNMGNVDQRIGARVQLLDRNDSEVLRKTPIDGLTNFARTSTESSGTLVADKMPFGEFKVRLDVSPVDDAGNATNSGADTVTVTRTVWLFPYWLIVLAIVLVVLAFASIIWVVAAKATRRKAKRDLERSAVTPQPPPAAQL